jgi:hypothetical protein
MHIIIMYNLAIIINLLIKYVDILMNDIIIIDDC